MGACVDLPWALVLITIGVRSGCGIKVRNHCLWEIDAISNLADPWGNCVDLPWALDLAIMSMAVDCHDSRIADLAERGRGYLCHVPGFLLRLSSQICSIITPVSITLNFW